MNCFKINSYLIVFMTLIIYIKSQDCEYGFFFNGTNCNDCGITYFSPNVRIVGGVEAVQNSWPAQVLVVGYVEDSTSFYAYCGGTIINPYTILTAAHCYVDIYRDDLYFIVYAGAHNITSILNNGKPNDPAVVVRRVSETIYHENYDMSSNLNDIALHLLSEPILTNKLMSPACLPNKTNDYPKYNTPCWAAGWGRLSENGPLPTVLYNVNLTIYDPSYCSQVLVDQPKNWNSQICAGEVLGGKDTCQGDSGGGLLVKEIVRVKTKYFVSGIVSLGEGCAHKNSPGIYTKVSHYIDWIKSNWRVTASTTSTTTTTVKTTKLTSTTNTTAKTTKLTSKKTNYTIIFTNKPSSFANKLSINDIIIKAATLSLLTLLLIVL